MEFNKIENIEFEDLSKQLAIKVLSNKNDLYAMWIEKDKVIMQIHYSKKENEIKLLEGTIGEAIKSSSLSEEQKIFRCTEALQHALWEYNHQNTQRSKSPMRIDR